MNRIVLLIGVLLAPLVALAEIKLPALFSDGMVLQQKQVLPVWGWADAGTTVTVAFAGDKASTTTPASGKWMLKLPAQAASAEGRQLTVTVGGETKTIKDVLVGEVWLCAGQSNMDFTLSALGGKAREPQYQPLADYNVKEVSTANDPLLRQIAVPRVASAKKTLDNFDGSWIKAVPGSVGNFTGTGYYFARELRRELKVPVGLIKCPWGGTLVEPWMPPSAFAKGENMQAFHKEKHDAIDAQLATWDPAKAKVQYEQRLAKWKQDVEKAKAEKKRTPRRPGMATAPDQNRTTPSALFNAMIHPLIPYAVKGGIWYQGESNRRQHNKEYSQYFGAMISSWRELWNQGDFPFYYCQLAQYMDPPAAPLADDAWTDVCDQQRLTLALPNTGMAVLNDVGEAKDIHPRNKWEAGRRLSLWALAKDYGKSDLVYSGPLYKGHAIKDNKVVVTFDSVGSGLMVGEKPIMEPTKPADGPLQRFQIAGADKQWQWAQAKISGKNTVEVWHPEIPNPAAVRYAWAPNAKGANLYNKEGLPASLFKTDNW